jgi:hypothetical protein
MNSPTLLCIDLPQALELRKETLESHGYSVKRVKVPLTT